MTLLRIVGTGLLLSSLAACADVRPGFDDIPDANTGLDSAMDARTDVINRDTRVDVPDTALDPDAACTSARAVTQVERLPVDIIWVIDNSSSMAPAIDQVIAGLNNFATLVGGRGLDYRVIMLSLRNKTRTVQLGGSTRYTVCIPPPLSSDTNCGNGPRFLHSSIDIRSTQPLDQFLGTLGQTPGYMQGEQRGGEPWRDFLRPNATKTIVVVSDDDTRLIPDDFEHLRDLANPNATQIPNPNNAGLMLPPGILEPYWNGLFTNYTFTGIYGWGSETDPTVRCTFTNGSFPAKSGENYTTLVQRTNGVRAQLCSGAPAWTPFFNSVATAVESTARVACDVAVPPPPDGSVIDPARVNVALLGTTRIPLGRVNAMSNCTAAGGWYFDNNQRPTRVFLCPTSCTRAQTELRGNNRGIEVLFGCLSIPG